MAKSSEPSYIKNVIVASIVVAIMSGYPIIVYLNVNQFYSICAGFVISLLNAIIGNFMNEMAFNKSVKSFMILVFGGMGIRLLIMGILLLLFIYYGSFNSVYLVSSLFFFYVLFVSMEIWYLHKRKAGPVKIDAPPADENSTNIRFD